MNGRRRIAWVLLLVVNGGFAAWGFVAAAFPHYLLGPGGKSILPAGYEGYGGGSWAELVSSSPMTAKYIEILFRMYGVFNLIVGLMGIAIAATAFRRGDAWAWWTLLVANTMALVSAMTYDATVNAIGPFELSEYLGLLLVYIALALTARLRTAGQAIAATGLQGLSCERCESASMPVSVSPECLHAGRRIEGTQVDGGERSGGT